MKQKSRQGEFKSSSKKRLTNQGHQGHERVPVERQRADDKHAQA